MCIFSEVAKLLWLLLTAPLLLHRPGYNHSVQEHDTLFIGSPNITWVLSVHIPPSTSTESMQSSLNDASLQIFLFDAGCVPNKPAALMALLFEKPFESRYLGHYSEWVPF